MSKVKSKVEYVMYKGEQLLHIGTIEEIAEERGVLPHTIYWYTTQAYQRRLAKRKKLVDVISLTPLDDDDDE